MFYLEGPVNIKDQDLLCIIIIIIIIIIIMYCS